MIDYLLKSGSCLALLLLFYHLVLEKEKMHNFNRFYLLGSVLFSFFVPLTTITIPSTPEIIESVQSSFHQAVYIENTVPIMLEETFDYRQLCIGMYILISSILFIRFGKNVFKIVQKIRLNEKVKHKNALLVLVDDEILPHTFWKTIFINKIAYKQGKIEEELFTHELTHVTQKHTLDIIIIELLQILFWINPLFIFLKKAIQLNHEFLADETVINQHKNTFQYQHLLLNKAAWNNEYYLASNLNYSLTKKRLKMMTTQSSHTKVLLKKLAVIPLLVGGIFLFAERVEAQEKEEIIEITEDLNSEKINIDKTKIYKEYFYRNGFIQNTDKNGKNINKKYSELTTEEKKKVPPPPPLKTKRKVPTQKLIEDLKDTSKYAIWINEKVVKNTILNNYKNTDFSSHFVSFVHKNARSKRFPQEYQAHLKTSKYFKTQNEKRVNDFTNYLKKEYKIEEIKEEPKKKDYLDSPIPTNNASKQSIASTKTDIKAKNKDDIRLKVQDVNNLKIRYKKTPSFIDEARKENQNKDKSSPKYHYTEQTFWVKNKDGKKIAKKYYELSDYFKRKWMLFPPITTTEKQISNKEFDRIKDESIYIVRINGIAIKNSKLKNFKSTDFASYSKSIISKYAKFKQKYHYNLLDKEGLKIVKLLKKSQLNKQDPKFNKGWFITIDGQKYYYTFDSQERIARYYNKGKLVNLDIVKEYKKKHKIYENLKSQGRHYVFISKQEQKVIDKEFSDLGGMYFRMSRADKNKVPYPNNPVKPYIRLRKDNKIWYKLRTELTEEDKLLIPPPPPNPNASKEEILKAKKAYKDWKKRTGNDIPIPPPPKKTKKN